VLKSGCLEREIGVFVVRVGGRSRECALQTGLVADLLGRLVSGGADDQTV